MTVDILGAYWTTAGPVQIGTGREWSLFDWPDRCAEAAEVGMSGLGIWHTDLAHLRETRSLAEIKQIFDDHGLRHLELEFINDWFLPEGDEARAESDRQRDLLFEAAAALDAHHIKVGNLRRTPAGVAQQAEAFGALCAVAADRHDAPLTYELIPFDPHVRSLDDVLQVVRGAAAPNGGICLDTWHLGKLGITPDDLRVIPSEYLTYVELSDGMRESMPDGGTETTRFRRLPGEGEFDIPGYVRVLAEIGYAGPWGVEVLSDELRALPMPQMFRRTVETAAHQIEKGTQK